MKTAQNVDAFKSGDTLVLQITVVDENEAVKNITGATITWVMERNNVQVSKTVGSGIVLTAPASGVFTVTVPSTETREWGGGYWDHEAQMTLSGVLHTVTTGTIHVVEGLVLKPT